MGAPFTRFRTRRKGVSLLPSHPPEFVVSDVRQAESTLISAPDGKRILGNGGVCRTEWNRCGAAETVILPSLGQEGITRLDLVIGIHPGFDQIRGPRTRCGDETIAMRSSGRNPTVTRQRTGGPAPQAGGGR